MPSVYRPAGVAWTVDRNIYAITPISVNVLKHTWCYPILHLHRRSTCNVTVKPVPMRKFVKIKNL